MHEVYGVDAYSPPQIAGRIEAVGVKKARLPLIPLVALGVLAGGFIGLGGMFATLVLSDPNLSFALSRLLAGLVFSLGLILVVVAGAELFTGNNLMVMSWVQGRISTRLLLRNFVIVYLANLFGAVGLALLVWWAQSWQLGQVEETAVTIARGKVELTFQAAFFRGVLANLLVCLAVWLAMAGRTVSGKILAIIFPITAFVACGLEHCVANMYLIPLGMLLAPADDPIGIMEFLRNLLPVTLGNLVGGAGLVGLVYHLIYGREGKADQDSGPGT